MSKLRIWTGKLETIAFVSGFVLMVFELAGARILAPGIGSSTYVWTSVIGVIIAALSLGYWAGGKIADARGYMIDLARLLLLIGLTITIVVVTYKSQIAWIAGVISDPRLQGVIASLVLFAPTSFLLGVLSPYLAKMNIRSLETSGRAVASLSALNSIGGIVGTFMAGFVLFGLVGSRETFGIIALLMVALSWLAVPSVQYKRRGWASIMIVAALGFAMLPSQGVAFDTPSAHYTINNYPPLRVLATGPTAAQSGVVIDSPGQLAFWYTNELARLVDEKKDRKDILVLGGGAFTLPRHLAEKYPEASIDVVEIDPELVAIAREYFYYDDPSNINLIFEDARTYVNRASKLYDVILIDVYSSTQVPFSLITREYGERVKALTKPDGLVAANLIAHTKDACSQLLNALDAPYRAQFNSARYKIEKPNEERSNMIAAYSQDSIAWSGSLPLNIRTERLYTDNFMPAERLQQGCKIEG